MEIARREPPDRMYRELYEAACEGRRKERAVANWYKRQYREERRARRRLAHIGLGVVTAINVAAWIVGLVIGG